MNETQKAQLKAKINDVRETITGLAPSETLAAAANGHLNGVDADIDTWRVSFE